MAPHTVTKVMTKLEPLETYQYSEKVNFNYLTFIGSCEPEGFVIRTARGFPFNSLESCAAKYVRAGHVQTEETWRRTWKQAKLKK